MDIQFNNLNYEIIPWDPDAAPLSAPLLSLDTETTRIDAEKHWHTPTYVLGAVFDGERGYFLRPENVAEFLERHSDAQLIMHNAPFDLAVLNRLAPEASIYDRVEKNLVWDTYLLHRLLRLATSGDTARGQSSLAYCVEHYLGVELPKDNLLDSRGNVVRLSYGQWLGRSPQEIEPSYLDYLAKDVIATFLVHEEIASQLEQALESAEDALGYISVEHLHDQIDRWGPQTHHIQLRGAIALRSLTAEGLTVDPAKQQALAKALELESDQLLKELGKEGYAPGRKGSNKALQEIMRGLSRKHSDIVFERTDTGKYATSKSALEPLQGLGPFVDSLLKYRETKKLQATYVHKMTRTLHPKFDPVLETGRTSPNMSIRVNKKFDASFWDSYDDKTERPQTGTTD